MADVTAMEVVYGLSVKLFEEERLPQALA